MFVEYAAPDCKRDGNDKTYSGRVGAGVTALDLVASAADAFLPPKALLSAAPIPALCRSLAGAGLTLCSLKHEEKAGKRQGKNEYINK